MSQVVIFAFYKFAPLPDYAAMIEPLRQVGQASGVLGTVLLAPEGINGTIAGSQAGIDAVLAYLRADARLHELGGQITRASKPPFRRLRIRKKRAIVTLGRPEVDPTRRVGRYVSPAEWNTVVRDPEVIVVDTRNNYEVHVGTFRGAVNPETASFSEFPEFAAQQLNPHTHKKVAMFCTGGIRCEKASSLLLEMGFEEVLHLQGGILNYLAQTPEEDSLWEGECFVFDDRVTVDHALRPGSYVMCFACKSPLGPNDVADPAYQEGISCPFCIHTLTDKQIRGFTERQKQVQLAREKGMKHLGNKG